MCDGPAELCLLVRTQVREHRMAQGTNTRRKRSSIHGALPHGNLSNRLDLPEAQQVRGTAGFRGRSDGRAFPSTKRLTANDRARDATVNVEVSGLNTIQPHR